MYKVGVTGGTGFIGQYLLRDYCDSFDFVVATSKSTPAKIVPGVSYVKTDYSKESFAEVFNGCDAVVSLGAKTPNSVTAVGCITDYFDNMESMQNLLYATAELGITNFVDISSVSVYDKSVEMPMREDGEIRPGNSYGISKVAIELYSDLFARKAGIAIKTLRVSQVLGYREYAESGFFGMLLKNSLNQKALTVYGEGVAARDYIYVKDVTAAIVAAINKPKLIGCYNIGSGVPTTNLALADAYCVVFENPEGIVHVPVEKDDKRFWYMDVSKAKLELGFEARFGLLEMIQDIRMEREKALLTGDVNV